MYGTGKFHDFEGFRIWMYDDEANTKKNERADRNYLAERKKALTEESAFSDLT